MPNNCLKALFLFIISIHSFPLLYGAPAAQSVKYYNEGVESFKTGDLSTAESKFLESLKLSPYYSLAYYGLGRVYLSTEGSNDEAITCLKKSIELDPGLAKGFFYLGLAELLGGRYVESIHSFKSAYDLDRKFVESLYNIATIYEHLGKSYNAFVYYRRYVDETEK
jgi:tetratricopeptide (TPR) repeat protein